MNSKCLVFLIVLSAGLSGAVGRELRCRCIRTFSKFVPLRQLTEVEVIPIGMQCKNMQVIATLISGMQICLNPEARWVKAVVNRMMERVEQNPE
ncbi:interleukin-8-like [Heptranchias perlo]|uniref:interleukin-8-like n=1 Tax=Heptranchias perlo TaxID=212740 RepID=UPI00355A1FF6